MDIFKVKWKWIKNLGEDFLFDGFDDKMVKVILVEAQEWVSVTFVILINDHL